MDQSSAMQIIMYVGHVQQQHMPQNQTTSRELNRLSDVPVDRLKYQEGQVISEFRA